jgi:hypothetical protein
MVEDLERYAALAVTEHGAVWPSWIQAECQRQAANVLFETVSDLESSEEFLARVLARLQALTSPYAKPEEAVSLRIAMLVVSSDVSVAAKQARMTLGSGLLAEMNRHGRGRLILAYAGATTDAIQHALLSLAGALCDEHRGGTVPVSVRLAESRSGFMAAVQVEAEYDRAKEA